MCFLYIFKKVFNRNIFHKKYFFHTIDQFQSHDQNSLVCINNQSRQFIKQFRRLTNQNTENSII